MISMNKKYRTRDGREVRIYAVDGEENYPVHGAVKNAEWSICYWIPHGKACSSTIENRLDLIEVKPRIKRKIWINWYRRDDGAEVLEASMSKAEACDVGTACIACVEIDIDVEEGHGL